MSNGNNSHNIFVSHTHSDKAIADAFKDAVKALFGNYVTVSYSSEPEHGPKHGQQWLEWINEQVKTSDFTLVFLTPSSVQKPWILWEAGAVAGTAVASGKKDDRKVRPLIFRVPAEQVPDPFRDIQLVHGDNYADMQPVFKQWMGKMLPPEEIAGAAVELKATLEKYLRSVEVALDNAPLIPTEGVVQEWSLRLDDLKSQNRMSEVKNLHDWLNIAFGRDQEDKPIDVRLHRRLGELYLNSGDYEHAAIQFELARLSSPRDIMILRDLGRSYLGKKDSERTKQTIALIEHLDPNAFERNVECAALKGRWLRQTDQAGAREVYRKAFLSNPNSYYVGDLLGQMELQLSSVESARITYRKVLEIINALGERNLWVQATAVNAAIVAGAEPGIVRKKLEEIREFHPSPENLRTIEDGLRRIQGALGTDDSVYKEWVAALRQ
jgi:tetratricopeptide (TPR) repeat protein